jgi:hypothetical protein
MDMPESVLSLCGQCARCRGDSTFTICILHSRAVHTLSACVRKRGVEFQGPEDVGYRALLWSRVANGIW